MKATGRPNKPQYQYRVQSIWGLGLVSQVPCLVDALGVVGIKKNILKSLASTSFQDGVSKRRLYIMTLGCLAPYRRLGIGTRMVEHVMEIVEQDGNFDSVFLHVQVAHPWIWV